MREEIIDRDKEKALEAAKRMYDRVKGGRPGKFTSCHLEALKNGPSAKDYDLKWAEKEIGKNETKSKTKEVTE